MFFLHTALVGHRVSCWVLRGLVINSLIWSEELRIPALPPPPACQFDPGTFCTSVYLKWIRNSLTPAETYSEDTLMFTEHQEFPDYKESRGQSIFHSYLYSETGTAAGLLTILHVSFGLPAFSNWFFTMWIEDIFLAIKMPVMLLRICPWALWQPSEAYPLLFIACISKIVHSLSSLLLSTVSNY